MQGAGAVQDLVGIDSGIAIVEVATQQAVDKDGDLAGGGGNGLGLADAIGDATVVGTQGGGGTAGDHGAHAQDGGGTVGRRLGLRAEQAAPGDLVLGGK